MQVLKIKIQSLEDARNGIPVLEGFNTHEQFVEYKDVTAVIQEGGMQSGATSIMFLLQREGDEKAHFGEISGKLLEILYATYRGAQARWGQPVGDGKEN